jgi:hypothetical protein
MNNSDNNGRTFNLFIFAAVVAIFAFGGLRGAEAASLYFSPSEGNFYRNENFNAGVYVSSDQSVNAVQGVISFPTKYVEVVSINSNGASIIDLWVMKPSFSNAGESGNVYFEGVVLNPGFAGSSGKVMDIVFRVKKEGPVDLNFSEFAVLANDGLGTILAASAGKANFVFLPPRAAVESVQSEERIKSVEEKIRAVEEKIKTAGEPRPAETEIPGFWYVLPKILKIAVFVFIIIGTIIFSFAVLGFVIISLIWLWNRFWRQRRKIERGIESFPRKSNRFLKRILRFFRLAEQELEGDAKYAGRQFKKDFTEAVNNKSFKETLIDYWRSILKIIKRFTEKNSE